MNTDAKISILIANYNNGHFFKDAFDSLVTQTTNNWEAIVIDDCSTDNSVQIITSLIKNNSRFKFFQNKQNIGYQKTLIKAIELSNAPIFGRLDPDDALLPEAIEKSVKVHEKNKEVGLVYSNLIFCDEALNPIRVHKTGQITDLSKDYLYLNGAISHFATFKKEFYTLTTGIDSFNKRAEDKDLYMKMCEVAPVKHINENFYLYRVHKDGASSFSNTNKAYFWYWVALIKMAERRNINIEDLFLEEFIRRKDFLKSRWVKLGIKLGFLKTLK